jgi:hypothetical protein
MLRPPVVERLEPAIAHARPVRETSANGAHHVRVHIARRCLSIARELTSLLRSLDPLVRVLSQRTSCVRINIMNRFLRGKKAAKPMKRTWTIIGARILNC